jgi:phosphatidylglycerophosphatase A
MLSHPAHIIALGGGLGLARRAPGTFGTLLGFPLGWLLAGACPLAVAMAVLMAAFLLGVWACGATGSALGVADHGAMVWDEVVAFGLVVFFTPAHWVWQLGAFALFRFFDIVKPPPIRYFDRALKNGFGVMFDDIVAALYALAVLGACRAALGG